MAAPAVVAAVRRRDRATLEDETRAAARRLGLSIEPDRATGTLRDDLELDVELTDEPIAGGFCLRCSVALTPALGLGLILKPRTGLLRVVDEPEPNLGWEFHDYYTLEAFDRRRAVDLLKGSPARELTALTRYAKVELSDTELRLSIEVSRDPVSVGVANNAAELTRRAAALAASILLRRPLLRPCESEQSHLRLLERVAQTLGGRVDRSARRLEVERPHGLLKLWIERVGSASWTSHFTLELASPPRTRFKLTDESERSTWQRWRDPDIQLHDEEFDRVFVVRSDDPAGTRACLHAEARSALLDLRRRVRHMVVDDSLIGASLDIAVRDVALVESLLAALERAASALSTPTRPHSSAYR